MRFRDTIDWLSSAVVAGAAMIMTGVFLYNNQVRSGAALPVTYIETWRDENALGIRMGPDSAKVVITEFMDFTCPFCRQLVPVLKGVMARYPHEVAVVFQHFPLPGRELSMPAAIAAECAYRQDRFSEMYHLLYEQGESWVRSGEARTWTEIAGEIGVSDIDAFDRCIRLPADSFPRIANGTDLGRRTEVRGTPTVWVNGEVFMGRDSTAFLKRLSDLGL